MPKLPKLKLLAPVGVIKNHRRAIDFDMKISALEVHVAMEIQKQGMHIDRFDYSEVFGLNGPDFEKPSATKKPVKQKVQEQRMRETGQNSALASTFYDEEEERKKHRIPHEVIQAK
jgi:hypothetical protein